MSVVVPRSLLNSQHKEIINNMLILKPKESYNKFNKFNGSQNTKEPIQFHREYTEKYCK